MSDRFSSNGAASNGGAGHSPAGGGAPTVDVSGLTPRQILALRSLLQCRFKTLAAQRAGVSRQTLYRWMRRDSRFFKVLQQARTTRLTPEVRIKVFASLERVMHFSTPAMARKRPECEASGPRRISKKILPGPLNEAGGPFPGHPSGGMELAPLLRRDRSMGLRTRFSQSLLAAEPIPCRRGGAKVHNTLLGEPGNAFVTPWPPTIGGSGQSCSIFSGCATDGMVHSKGCFAGF